MALAVTAAVGADIRCKQSPDITAVMKAGDPALRPTNQEPGTIWLPSQRPSQTGKQTQSALCRGDRCSRVLYNTGDALSAGFESQCARSRAIAEQ